MGADTQMVASPGELAAWLGQGLPPFDAGDLLVHVAASTVLERCPHPLSELEVAVVLETCGYNRGRARSCGAVDLMDLARQVYALVPVYAKPPTEADISRASGDSFTDERPGWLRAVATVGSFARGLLFALPLLVSLTTMLAAGVSFWSSKVELASVADSVTMSACLALICTGPFIYAFVRRASFYLAFGDRGMLAYVTRRALGTGMVVAAAACLAAYFVRTSLATQAAPPAASRLGLAAGLAIAALQVGLSPFYLRRTVVPMVLVVGGGGAVVLWHATHLGAYIDPVDLAVWQVRLVAVMAAATWLVDCFWLLRGAKRGPHGTPARRLWLPSGVAVARAVAPYAAFGLGYFCLVAFPQLVSGGAWLGQYRFDGPFSLASGMALMTLVPIAGFGNVAAQRLTKYVLPSLLARERVTSLERARVLVRRHWGGQVVVAVAAAAGTAAVIDLVLPEWAHSWLVAHGMSAPAGLLYICSAGYFLLSVGTFSCLLLFGVSASGRAVVAALSGTAVMLASSAWLSLTGEASFAMAAAVGFAAGCAVYAAVAVHAGAVAFSQADFTCYHSL